MILCVCVCVCVCVYTFSDKPIESSDIITTVWVVFRAVYVSGARYVWSVSMIGGSGDTTIPSPGTAPKQPLPGIGLRDPLHGQQACPEFNSFHEGVGQISPPEGL